MSGFKISLITDSLLDLSEYVFELILTFTISETFKPSEVNVFLTIIFSPYEISEMLITRLADLSVTLIMPEVSEPE